jgi:holin-like protein
VSGRRLCLYVENARPRARYRNVVTIWFFVAEKEAAPKLIPGVQELLRHLSLLFIPAGVGIMVHGKTVLDEWIPLVIALVLSTAISIVVTALCVKWMSR